VQLGTLAEADRMNNTCEDSVFVWAPAKFALYHSYAY